MSNLSLLSQLDDEEEYFFVNLDEGEEEKHYWPDDIEEEDEETYNWSDDTEEEEEEDYEVKFEISDQPTKMMFRILTEEELLSRIEDQILRVSSLLSVPRYAATMLLLQYNWNDNTIREKWLGNQESLSGLLLQNPSEPMELMVLAMSYVDNSENLKWCPNPGCNRAVEYCNSGLRKNFDVQCKCFFGFCWNCLGEAHSPVDCETVRKWMAKNRSDLESENWKLANTTPCPKCQTPIENIGNQSGLDMTCAPPCGYVFCWLCSGDWWLHDSSTGGYGACNIYETAKKEGKYNDVERKRKRAKNLLDYYKTWKENDISMENEILEFLQMKYTTLESLSEMQGIPETQLQCIIDAWVQIVECRRVLKWSSVYGYYLPENEHKKKEFFDYLMTEGGDAFNRLRQYVEAEVFKYLGAKSSWDDLRDFRTKLVSLTSVTRKYFENLVSAMENGLSDVNSDLHQQDIEFFQLEEDIVKVE